MQRPFDGPLKAVVLATAALVAAGTAWADDASDDISPGHWRLVASPFTQHFRYSAEHRSVYALGLERAQPDGLLVGATYFRNSFGQHSAYAYFGQRREKVWGLAPLFLQWSAGILYGYRGKYENKVPLNVHGFAPGALFSAGWQFSQQGSAVVHLLGDAGFMLQLSYDLH